MTAADRLILAVSVRNAGDAVVAILCPPLGINPETYTGSIPELWEMANERLAVSDPDDTP